MQAFMFFSSAIDAGPPTEKLGMEKNAAKFAVYVETSTSTTNATPSFKILSGNVSHS